MQQDSPQVLQKGSAPGLFPYDLFTATGWITDELGDRGYKSQFPLIKSNRLIMDHPVTEEYSLLQICNLFSVIYHRFQKTQSLCKNTLLKNTASENSEVKIRIKFNSRVLLMEEEEFTREASWFHTSEVFLPKPMQIMSLLWYSQISRE